MVLRYLEWVKLGSLPHNPPVIYRFRANPAAYKIEGQRFWNPTPSAVLAPGSALRLPPRIAVSSAQAQVIL